MRCEKVEGLLSRFLDGDWEDSDRKAVEGHLRLCAVCAARFAELERMSKRLHAVADAIPEMRPDADAYWASLQGKLDSAPRAVVLARVPWRALVPAAGAAASILFGAMFWFTAGGSGQTPLGPDSARSAGESGIVSAQEASDAPARPERTAPRETHSGLDLMPVGPGAHWVPPSERPADDSEVIWF